MCEKKSHLAVAYSLIKQGFAHVPRAARAQVCARLRIFRLGDTREARRRLARLRQVTKEKATFRWLSLLHLGGDGGIHILL